MGLKYSYVSINNFRKRGSQWSGRPCEVDIDMTKGYDIPQNMFPRGILPQNNV